MNNKTVLNIGSTKHIDYDKLDGFESVSIVVVFIMSITAGVMLATNLFYV